MEQLIQTGQNKKGKKIGKSNYEFYDLGAENVKTLIAHKILPQTDSTIHLRKPDQLLIDRTSQKGKIFVELVIEYKTPSEFVSEKQKLDALSQAGSVAIHLKCPLILATDGISYVWGIPTDTAPNYEIIKYQDDNYPFDEKIDFINPMGHENALKTISELKKNLIGSYIVPTTKQNPTTLAKSIWQINWISTNCPPEKALSTFVELFIFKYISDLNVLTKDSNGYDCSFNYILGLNPQICLVQYFAHVRDQIKKLFPPSIATPFFDSTTVINGFTLDPTKPEDNRTFHLMLKKFQEFGKLNNIDKEFKTRLFEDFLKDTDTIKEKGQFFTPRNIIKAIVEMAQIDNLNDGASVCDPACGVGGFLLESMYKRKMNDIFYSDIEKTFKSKINYYGFDIHDKNTDSLTIILAKANFLIYMSDILSKYPYQSAKISELVNNIFFSYKNTLLGSLSEIRENSYDIVLSNPPYVTKGTSLTKNELNKPIEEDDNYEYSVVLPNYKKMGKGKEGLFVEKIIRELKTNGKAFIILPDGVFSRVYDFNLRQYILNTCFIEGIISLPPNTFYTTPQKTYILCLKKKEKEFVSNEKVFTYIVKTIGERLDATRFATPRDNDLIDMQRNFKYFLADKENYSSNSSFVHIFSENLFRDNIDNTWIPEKHYPRDKQLEIGYVVNQSEKSNSDLIAGLKDLQELIDSEVSTSELDLDFNSFRTVRTKLTNIFSTIESGSDKHTAKAMHEKALLFNELTINNQNFEKYPVFSGKTEDFGIAGYLDSFQHDFSNLKTFMDDYGNLCVSKPNECLTWVIDGKAGSVFYRKDTKFSMNNHCGLLSLNPQLYNNIYLPYFSLILPQIFEKYVAGEGGNKRLKLNQIRRVEIEYVENYNDQVLVYNYLKRIKMVEDKIKNFVNKTFK